MEEDERMMSRKGLGDEVERLEWLMVIEQAHERYDFARLRQLRYRIGLLDRELLARDLGGC